MVVAMEFVWVSSWREDAAEFLRELGRQMAAATEIAEPRSTAPFQRFAQHCSSHFMARLCG